WRAICPWTAATRSSATGRSDWQAGRTPARAPRRATCCSMPRSLPSPLWIWSRTSTGCLSVALAQLGLLLLGGGCRRIESVHGLAAHARLAVLLAAHHRAVVLLAEGVDQPALDIPLRSRCVEHTAGAVRGDPLAVVAPGDVQVRG